MQAVEGGQLLKLPFTTIFEYLQMLQLIATVMWDLEKRTMFYLAAAVSDFYVPWKDMVIVDVLIGDLDGRWSLKLQ
ncbi:Phosphopantothenate--cysteine ligase 1 [Euphorbia peplus]|nr:Phosphopantothenate--cysteine ligase 1 [Euphorbia peplus]